MYIEVSKNQDGTIGVCRRNGDTIARATIGNEREIDTLLAIIEAAILGDAAQALRERAAEIAGNITAAEVRAEPMPERLYRDIATKGKTRDQLAAEFSPIELAQAVKDREFTIEYERAEHAREIVALHGRVSVDFPGADPESWGEFVALMGDWFNGGLFAMHRTATEAFAEMASEAQAARSLLLLRGDSSLLRGDSLLSDERRAGAHRLAAVATWAYRLYCHLCVPVQ